MMDDEQLDKMYVAIQSEISEQDDSQEKHEATVDLQGYPPAMAGAAIGSIRLALIQQVALLRGIYAEAYAARQDRRATREP